MRRDHRESSRNLAPTMKAADRERMAEFLRTKLRNSAIRLETPDYPGATTQLVVSGKTLGTVTPNDDEGELSWAVTLVVLADELDDV